jgi:hypothetical protein
LRVSRLVSLSLPLLIGACARPPVLRTFGSDGCSLFPDQDKVSGESWCACCLDHDFAYWQGGSEAQRDSADRALGECVERRTGDAYLARAVYRGTQRGGKAGMPTWYRWGYGWPWRTTAPVTDSLRRIAVAEKGGFDRPVMLKSVCGE